MNADEIDELLNKQGDTWASAALGTGDMRDIIDAAKE